MKLVIRRIVDVPIVKTNPRISLLCGMLNEELNRGFRTGNPQRAINLLNDKTNTL